MFSKQGGWCTAHYTHWSIGHLKGTIHNREHLKRYSLWTINVSYFIRTLYFAGLIPFSTIIKTDENLFHFYGFNCRSFFGFLYLFCIMTQYPRSWWFSLCPDVNSSRHICTMCNLLIADDKFDHSVAFCCAVQIVYHGYKGKTEGDKWIKPDSY